MEILTPKSTRRSTRLRVEIPVSVTSLDRKHPFADQCVTLVVSAQGCGIRASQALPVKTPVLISNLPNGASASGHVTNCLPVGKDGKYFLVGVSLYNHGNVWGIANPPEDWNIAANSAPTNGPTSESGANKEQWPYNLFSAQGIAHPAKAGRGK